MEFLWFGTLAVLLTGYFALEGFTIGIGLLLPVPGRTPADRDRLVGAMAPFVLANEVWLVALVGVLLGAFPALEGRVIGELYPLVVALLLSWILRDAGLWFRRRRDGARWRSLWDSALFAGSAGLALTWGLVLAAVARGLRPDALLDPLGFVAGAGLAGVFAFHGRTFAAWRLAGQAGGKRRTGPALLGSACVAAAPAAVTMVALASPILEHAAPAETLTVLSVMVFPCVPILLGAQLWVWRTFSRGAVPSFF